MSSLTSLSIADLSALMARYSKQMSTIQDRTPENTELWEQLAFKRGCCATEFEFKESMIIFPEQSK